MQRTLTTLVRTIGSKLNDLRADAFVKLVILTRPGSKIVGRSKKEDVFEGDSIVHRDGEWWSVEERRREHADAGDCT
jgi:hypothetical protein